MNTLEISIDAFGRNLDRIRATVAPAKHMLVVKDDAYGHGLERIVRSAAAHGVEWFGAFDVATGLAVRQLLGDSARIFVWMLATTDEIHQAVQAGLDVGVGDPVVLEELANIGGGARVHLKVDSGLHRNGVRPEQWEEFVRRAAAHERTGAIRVVGVWSHIAEASDDADDAARAIFDEAVAAARAADLNIEVTHLSASAAAFARPEFRYDLVRVGAFAYGIGSAGGPPAAALGLTPVARLQATVVAVEPGVAVVGLGALHGVPSVLAERLVVGTPDRERLVTEIGVNDMRVRRWTGAKPGDVVTIFGDGARGESSATEIAEDIDTVGEEIVLRVSPLIRRVEVEAT